MATHRALFKSQIKRRIKSLSLHTLSAAHTPDEVVVGLIVVVHVATLRYDSASRHLLRASGLHNSDHPE